MDWEDMLYYGTTLKSNICRSNKTCIHVHAHAPDMLFCPQCLKPFKIGCWWSQRSLTKSVGLQYLWCNITGSCPREFSLYSLLLQEMIKCAWLIKCRCQQNMEFYLHDMIQANFNLIFFPSHQDKNAHVKCNKLDLI